MESPPSKRPQILYFEHGYFSDTPLHSHPYCQIEYSLGSPIRIYDGSAGDFLPPGVLWFIPPGTPHQFLKTPGQNFLSFKFHAAAPPAPCRTSDPMITFLMEQLRQLIDGETPFAPHSPDGDFLIECHLTSLLERLSGLPERKNGSDFKSRIYTEVSSRGAQLSIDDLAASFQMSRAQFKYAFYKEYSSGNIKEVIAHHLILLAQKELLYSDKTLSKIAEQLKFSSIYAFSRFFKAHCGISPLAFKKQAPPEEKKERSFPSPL